jgi:hypothetical protein
MGGIDEDVEVYWPVEVTAECGCGAITTVPTEELGCAGGGVRVDWEATDWIPEGCPECTGSA